MLLQSFILFHLPLPVYLRHQFWIKTPKPKGEQAGSLLKYDYQKLQWLYRHDATVNGSLPNLVRTSNRPVSKSRQPPHSRTSYTKKLWPRLSSGDWKLLLDSKFGSWCKDPAVVDNLGNKINCVNFRLVRQDLFNWTMNAKRMKTKDCSEAVPAF